MSRRISEGAREAKGGGSSGRPLSLGCVLKETLHAPVRGRAEAVGQEAEKEADF